MERKRVWVSYSTVELDLLPSLVEQLDRKCLRRPIGLIVAIPRGGCYTAVRLSQHYGLTGFNMRYIDFTTEGILHKKTELERAIKSCIKAGKMVIYVDDLICTGKAFEATKSYINDYIGHTRNQLFVTLYRRKSARIEKDGLQTVYAERITHNKWLDFFWEAKIDSLIPVYTFS